MCQIVLMLALLPVVRCTSFIVSNDCSDSCVCQLQDNNSSGSSNGGNDVPCCCSLEHIAGLVSHDSSILIVINSSIVFVHSKVVFANVDGIELTSSEGATIQCTAVNGAGFAFVNSSDIVIANLTFNNCSGSRQVFDTVFYGVLVFASRDVFLENVTIANSYGYGLALINTANRIAIIESKFLNNSNKMTQIDAGGILVFNHQFDTPSTYEIADVSISRNSGRLGNSRSNFSQGGGLHIHCYNTIAVEFLI